jgi:hypothetical protein
LGYLLIGEQRQKLGTREGAHAEEEGQVARLVGIAEIDVLVFSLQADSLRRNDLTMYVPGEGGFRW